MEVQLHKPRGYIIIQRSEEIRQIGGCDGDDAHLLLLAEVYIEELGVALRPFHPMEGCPSGHCLLWAEVLQHRKSKEGQSLITDTRSRNPDPEGNAWVCMYVR